MVVRLNDVVSIEALDMFPSPRVLATGVKQHLELLAPNIVDGSFGSYEEYITRHIGLLQADCFVGVTSDMQWFQINCGLRDEMEREELKRFGNEPTYKAMQKYFCNIYVECEVVGVGLMLDRAEAPSMALSFKLYNPNVAGGAEGLAPASSPIDWNSTSKLARGALVALSFDYFRSVYWATVSHSDPLLLSSGLTMVALAVAGEEQRFQRELFLRGHGAGLLMAEGEGLFGAFSTVLTSLLNKRSTGLPFTQVYINRQSDSHVYT
jgi:hypothetical protein